MLCVIGMLWGVEMLLKEDCFVKVVNVGFD